MDNKPSLSQYFGDTSVPPASQFFDEIGTSPSDMIQSVYLGDSEDAVGDGVPAVPGGGALLEPATPGGGALPDPATFFDSIGPEQLELSGALAAPRPYARALHDAMDGLYVKDQPTDKEEDPRRDAWIPSEETRKILEKVQSSPKGSYFPEREALTLPCLVLEEELADGLQEACVRALGVCAAAARGVLRAEHVSRDEAGLRELLRTGYLRAALNLTTLLLRDAAQAGRPRPARHSPRTLQLWLARFAVMLRLRLLEPLQREAEPFGELDGPDMFYEFYPESGRRGSLAPWALRLLLAELPAHAARPERALERLYTMRAVQRRMLEHLRAGRAEDGGGALPAHARAHALRLWEARDARLQHALVNAALAMKDYRLASRLVEALHAEAGAGSAARRALSSALGRLWLGAGHVARAEAVLARAAQERAALAPAPDARELLDQGLLHAARGEHAHAHDCFLRARDQDPASLAAHSNLCVSLLYLGRLREALGVLAAAVRAAPERALCEPVLLNLCTLYELHAARAHDNKLALLRLLQQQRRDALPDVAHALKLHAPPQAPAP